MAPRKDKDKGDPHPMPVKVENDGVRKRTFDHAVALRKYATKIVEMGEGIDQRTLDEGRAIFRLLEDEADVEDVNTETVSESASRDNEITSTMGKRERMAEAAKKKQEARDEFNGLSEHLGGFDGMRNIVDKTLMALEVRMAAHAEIFIAFKESVSQSEKDIDEFKIKSGLQELYEALQKCPELKGEFPKMAQYQPPKSDGQDRK